MREWLTVIIVLLIVGILLDGWRRMRQSRRDSIKMSLSIHKGLGKEDLETYGSELPNGGARVVGLRDDECFDDHLGEPEEPAQTRHEPQISERIQEQASFDLDDDVPMLMESVVDSAPENIVRVAPVREPVTEAIDKTLGAQLMGGIPKPQFEKVSLADTAVVEAPNTIEAEPKTKKPKATAKPVVKQTAKPVKTRVEQSKANSAQPQAAPEPQEVLVINVMAPKGQYFQGGKLLDLLVATDMRFGEMDIFHRHLDAGGEGPVLFSMANMVVPGTFELNKMREFSTPGVSLFLTLPLASDSLAAFNIMAGTAKCLVDNMGGELKDEQRSVMTNQTLEHCRQRILEFERKRLL